MKQHSIIHTHFVNKLRILNELKVQTINVIKKNKKRTYVQKLLYTPVSQSVYCPLLAPCWALMSASHSSTVWPPEVAAQNLTVPYILCPNSEVFGLPHLEHL